MECHRVRKKKEKGILIVFEGISGCGKSESIKRLKRFIGRMQPLVVEWNSNERIRGLTSFLQSKNILNSKIYSLLQWTSFLVDYFTKIKPKMDEGKIVICDRYEYTGRIRDRTNGGGRILGRLISCFTRKPDLLFYFCIDPKICYERMKLRGKQLFHTDKSVLKNNILKDKNLYYLEKMHLEYLRLMNSLKNNHHTQVVFLELYSDDLVMKTVQEYIERKCAAECEKGGEAWIADINNI